MRVCVTLQKVIAVNHIAHVLTSKKQAPTAWLPPTATVREALQLMADRDIGAVLIMQDASLKGIFTERDYARKIVLKGLSSVDAQLADVMTSRLYVVGPQQRIEECLDLMTQAHVRHLPVVDGSAVIGLVSIGDLVKAKLEEQRFHIEQLESYIAGSLA